MTVSSERYVADDGDAYDVMDFEVGTSIIEVVASIASEEERSEVLALIYAP